MAKKKKNIDNQIHYFKVGDEICFSSGCQILDCVLGAGWSTGRVTNLCGTSRTGKSLLCLEAVINHKLTFSDGLSRYADNEAALYKNHLIDMGFPIEETEFVRLSTIEQFYSNLVEDFIPRLKPNQHGIYICDSLDILPDQSEIDRKITESSFGASKAKKANEIMRKIIGQVEDSNVALFIVSYEKEKIGVTYGSKRTRACETPLEQGCSHVVWLNHTGDIKQTHNGIERPIGVVSRAKCSKNRIGRQGRECELSILFERGVNDILSNLSFLEDAESLTQIPPVTGVDLSKEDLDINQISKKIWSMEQEEFLEYRRALAAVTKQVWDETEDAFSPPPIKRY